MPTGQAATGKSRRKSSRKPKTDSPPNDAPTPAGTAAESIDPVADPPAAVEPRAKRAAGVKSRKRKAQAVSDAAAAPISVARSADASAGPASAEPTEPRAASACEARAEPGVTFDAPAEPSPEPPAERRAPAPQPAAPADALDVVWTEAPPVPAGVTPFVKPPRRVVPTRIEPPAPPPAVEPTPTAPSATPPGPAAPADSGEAVAGAGGSDSSEGLRPPVPVPPPEAGFDDFGLRPELVQACAAAGFVQPSEIQRRLMPLALAGRDVLGQSKTGSGKTAAFMLPVLHRLTDEPTVQALVLVPTRELCLQVQTETAKLSKFAPVKTAAILGGHAMRGQLDDLRRGARIVIGTPGRILDHLSRGTLRLHDIRFAILDEVDRMLDIGFRDDIRRILGRIQGPHQTVFVSATISDEIARLAARYMRDPEKVFLAPDDLTVPEVEQRYVSVERHDKYRLLKAMLKVEQPRAAIIFCATKRMADLLAEKMDRDGLNAAEIHGDLEQRRREAVLGKFRKGTVTYLVATDLASRGLDIPEVSHIINYDVPADVEGYVHRIGRTARMGAKGKAITLATREEGPQLTEIEKFVNKLLHPMEVPGFQPSPPPPDRARPVEAAPKPPPVSRFKRTVFWTTVPTGISGPVKAPVKTLGAKFPPHRKRRR
jgi:ATP-dependent RNA helicase DeaD